VQRGRRERAPSKQTRELKEEEASPSFVQADASTVSTAQAEMRSRIAAVSLAAFSVYVHAIQPSAPAPVPAPLRDLTWGQLNFLHTTDTHGWLAGHLQE
jgi:2',3'-cyclic-nucleotide 2'-phosphodiesterase (5'-nucleotidase family)